MLIKIDVKNNNFSTVVCPMMFNSDYSRIRSLCKLSECIAWRWYDLGPDEKGFRRGYCGLAGKPEAL